MAVKTSVHVRIDAEFLSRLEVLGKGITPKALNRSEMINVAVREYVERHDAKAVRKTGKN